MPGSNNDYTYALYTNMYLQIAEELGIGVEVFSEHSALSRVFTKDKELFIKICHLSVNSEIGIKASANKKLTYSCLRAADLPIPEHAEFSQDEYFKSQSDRSGIYKFAEGKYPVVAKPSTGFGGNGVYPYIRNEHELEKALDLLEQYDRKIIVEKHILGKHYRFTVANGETIDVTERIPANILGDGSHTIGQLINIKNLQRRPYGIPLISKGSYYKNRVSKDTIDWNSIPPKGKIITLSLLCNLSTGGDVVGIDTGIHQDFLDLAAEAARAIDLNFAGVDIISTDISKSSGKHRAIVNEVNSHPAPDIPYPTMSPERAREMPIKLLSKYFGLQ